VLCEAVTGVIYILPGATGAAGTCGMTNTPSTACGSLAAAFQTYQANSTYNTVEFRIGAGTIVDGGLTWSMGDSIVRNVTIRGMGTSQTFIQDNAAASFFLTNAHCYTTFTLSGFAVVGSTTGFYTPTCTTVGMTIYVANCFFGSFNIAGYTPIISVGSGNSGTAYSMTVTNTVFQNNSFVGGMCLQGTPGAATFSGLFVGCSFINNTVQQGSAVAISIGSYTQVTVTDCQFQNNGAFSSSSGLGGAIGGNSLQYPSIVSLTNVTCNGNFANVGGCINVYCSDLNIQKSQFSNNQAGLNGSESGIGGAVYGILFSSFSFLDSRCISNNALSNGGCIYLGISNSGDSGVVTLNNSIFLNNYAQTSGGVFYSITTKGVTISNCSFNGNFAGYSSGTIRFYGSSGISSCVVSITSSTFGSSSANLGGAISADNNCILNISQTSFQSCSSVIYGGGAIWAAQSSAYITNSTFLGCSSQQNRGGSIYISSGSKTLFIQGSSFVNSIAGTSGGAIYIDTQVTVQIMSSNFSGNAAKSGHGGGLYLRSQNSIVMTVVNYLNNSASLSGGALFLENNAFCSMANSTLWGNNAGNQGGALWFGQSTLVNASNTVISSNSVGFNGGGFYGAGGCINGNALAFSSNSAGDSGGGCYLEVSSCSNSLYSVSLQNNKAASGSGGGIWSSSSVLFQSVSIVNNSASSGGGAYLSASGMLVYFSNLSQNVASQNGSNIWLFGSIQLFSSVIQGSQGAQYGGALYLASNSQMSMFNCSIFGNQVNAFGGGIYVDAGGNVSINASTLSSNVAISGGGIYLSQGTNSSITSSAVSNNLAVSGGGIYATSWPIYLTNSRIFSNSASYQYKLCGSTEGSGGGLFVRVLDCSNLVGNFFSSYAPGLSVFNNNASRFGGGIGFGNISFSCNVSSLAAQLIPLLQNNSASYGQDFGSPPKSMVLNASVQAMPYNAVDRQLSFIMYESFNQVVLGDLCDINVTVVQSSVPNRFQYGLIVPLQVTLSPVNQIPYYFAFGSKFEAPYPYDIVNVTVEIGALTMRLYANTSLSVCIQGQIVRPDSIKIWRCQDCVPGTRISNDSTECLFCPAGYYSGLRSLNCSICSPGTQSLAGSAGCVNCALGKKSTQWGAAVCDDCPLNQYGSNASQPTSCMDCPLNSTTKQTGSPTVRSCICPVNEYGAPYFGIRCQKCNLQSGVICPEDSILPFVTAGHWRVPGVNDRVLDCIPAEACPETGVNETSVCQEGYTGYLCGQCLPYQYFRLEKTCRKCNSAPAFMWFLLISMIVCFLFVAFKFSLKVGRIPFVSLSLRITLTFGLGCAYRNRLDSDNLFVYSCFLCMAILGALFHSFQLIVQF
jgi:hypothetical protein